MELKIKKLNDKAVLPKAHTDGAAGIDLVATSCTVENRLTGPVVIYGTGLAIELPKGHLGLIMPRSSISTNTSLMLSNSVGLLDEDYRGEITFVFKNMNNSFGKKYEIGDRIGQLVVIPYPKYTITEVTELSETKRNQGSYGSTGK